MATGHWHENHWFVWHWDGEHWLRIETVLAKEIMLYGLVSNRAPSTVLLASRRSFLIQVAVNKSLEMRLKR